MRLWPLIVAALTTACATLPDSQPLPAGEEAAHAVAEIAPGRWHVMVRANYFSPPAEAERLLRERAANLCPGAEAVVEDLRLVNQPHQASAMVSCRAEDHAALDRLVSQLTADATTRSPAPAERGVVLPVTQETPERSLVKSGPGVATLRPEPGFLPPFAQVSAGHPETVVAAAPPEAEETEMAGGWIPATGDADGPAAVTVAEEELAAEPPTVAAETKPFWPAVGETYRTLVAEVE